MSNRNANPPKNPITTGVMLPISIAGISSDHTDAATITPDANPKSIFWNNSGISFFIKNTNADPKTVPANGIKSAVKMASNIIFLF